MSFDLSNQQKREADVENNMNGDRALLGENSNKNSAETMAERYEREIIEYRMELEPMVEGSAT